MFDGLVNIVLDFINKLVLVIVEMYSFFSVFWGLVNVFYGFLMSF